MKFENLYEGQVFKNYKDLCATLEITPTDGSSKRAQFKDLDTYCEYHKEGHKIIIDEIFDTNEVDRIYLNFSDPWPKDRHAKRRLPSKEFLNRYVATSRSRKKSCDIL